MKNLKKDLEFANKYNGRSKLRFSSDMNAVYHFRKHGDSLECKTIKVYMKDLPEWLIRKANLATNQKFEVSFL